MYRRDLLVALGIGFAGCLHSGSGGEDGRRDTDISLSSPAFDHEGEIPSSYTCEGENESPALRIENVPDEAETLALVMDDPDAPNRTFVHWLLWNVPADTEEIGRGVPQGETVEELGGARQGTNDADEVGYSGPCPPEGDGAHTYRFVLYALDEELGLEPDATRDELDDAIEENFVAKSRLEGTYER